MSQLARNTLMLTAASVGQKLIAFLYFALIARTIGDDATGSYFIALALVTTIGVLDDVGLTSVTIREVAKVPEKAKDYIRNVIGIKLITMPITIILAFVLPAWRGFDDQTTILVQIAIAVMILDTLSLSMYGVLRGLHKLKYESIGIFLGQSFTAAFGTIFLLTGTNNLSWLVVALIIGSGWNFVFAAWQVVRKVGWEALRPSYNLAKPMLKMSFMFFLAAVFVKVYSYVDSFIIQEFIGIDDVGVYAVAYKFTYAFQFLPLAFVGALYPTMSALANNLPELNKTLMKAEWYLALLAAPIVFGIFALAPELIHFFYGAEFNEAIPALQTLIFVLLFIFLDFPVGSLLNATGRQAVKTSLMGAAMVVNVVANLILVPEYGIRGAAISALITFAILFISGWTAATIYSGARFSELVKEVGRFLIAGVIMAIVVIWLKQYLYWMITIPIGAIVFFAIAFITRSLTLEHFYEARRIVWPSRYGHSPVSDN